MPAFLTRAGTPTAKIVAALSRKVHSLGGIILALMMLVTAVDVMGRYLLNRPIKGASELNELMLIVLVFLGLAFTATQKGHVRVELIISQFSEKGQALIETFTSLLGLALFFVITWQAVVLAVTQRSRDLTTSVLFIPVFPFALIVAFGSGLLVLVLIGHLFEYIGQVLKGAWKTRDWLMPALILGLLVVVPVWWLVSSSADVNPLTVGLAGMGLMLVLLFLGMPIGFVMALIGFMGMFFVVGPDAGLTILRTVPYTTAGSYSLSVVPLFILMGAFAFHTGLSKALYLLAYRWLGHMPGGLAMATIGGCAGFAAVSGSSLATAATMGMVALPEMKRYHYDPALATGCIAAGGSIGILIPPSVVLVIYGILTSQSIGSLFLAGFIPGVLEAVFYIGTIYFLCKRNPQMGPPGERSSYKQRLFAFKDTWEAVILFAVVIGGLYAGVFTPTEAAGVGAFGALVFTLVRRQMNRKNFFSSLADSSKTTAMAFAILIGAMILGYFLTVTQLPFFLADYVAGLQVNRYVILFFILIIFVMLGCVMDSLSIVILTVPIFYPVITALDFNPIWFGIILVRVVEIGMITPPVGINVFIIKGVAPDVPMYTIFRGILPFLVADICHLALLIAVPQISLWLPSLQ